MCYYHYNCNVITLITNNSDKCVKKTSQLNILIQVKVSTYLLN